MELFVLHAPGDAAWVRGYLLPELGLPEGAVGTPADFRPGAPLADELERAVAGARVVLLVLTPALLDDTWSKLGEQLASHAAVGGPEGQLVLNARLSRCAVVRGSIQYPEPFQAPGEASASSTGRLVVAKALLTRDLPYELLTYALKETAFPHQSTGDQFFDHEQFDAYRALGFHIGTAAAEAVRGGR
jgi:hypothetical protein